MSIFKKVIGHARDEIIGEPAAAAVVDDIFTIG